MPHRPTLALLAALLLAACNDAAAPETDSAPEAADMQAPAAAAAAVLPETEVMSGALAGTWLNAGDGAPLVLIVPGSGPTDRDGNSPMGLRTSSYAKLARALGERGVSSVRVDKRGMFASAGAGDPNAVTVELYAEDYRGWIDAMRAQTDLSCIHLLGHSEGGLMVSAAAVGRSDVCAVVQLAAPGRPLGDVLREQLRALPAGTVPLDDALAHIGRIEAGERVDVSGAHPALQALFAPATQDYLGSVLAVNPAAALAELDVPVLVVQGETDIQTNVADAERLGTAAGVESIIIDGMNHVLVDAPAERAPNIASYGQADAALNAEVAAIIAAFVQRTAD